MTSKAWNNVVILAVLFMAFLFMFVSDKMNQTTPSANRPLLEPYERIYQLAIGDTVVKKVGLHWQSQNQSLTQSVWLAELVQHWSDVELSLCAATKPVQSYSVIMWLVGSDTRYTLDVVFEQDAEVQVFLQNTCYRVVNKQLNQLIPLELQ